MITREVKAGDEFVGLDFKNQGCLNTTTVNYIYQIFNKKNGKIYIGRTHNFHQRMRQHVSCRGMRQEMGECKYWIIQILEVVRSEEPVGNRWLTGHIFAEVESKHIQEAIKSHGKKCRNKEAKWLFRKKKQVAGWNARAAKLKDAA